jgi:uncharacterized protein (UPF0332 family)
MTGTNRLANAASECARGDDALRAAKALLGLGLPNDAVSRAYYAAFHYARALLLTADLEPKTHRGVVALLLDRFEKPGRLEPGAVSELARLQTFRNLADYDSTERMAIDRATSEVEAAQRFIAKVKALLSPEAQNPSE